MTPASPSPIPLSQQRGQRCGSVGVTGILGLHDGGVIATTDYDLNFTQLTWTFLDGASTMTETAVRNGLATYRGGCDADSALIQFNDFTDRARPGKAVARIQLAR